MPDAIEVTVTRGKGQIVVKGEGVLLTLFITDKDARKVAFGGTGKASLIIEKE
jgi:hypothetical protein